MKVKTFPRGIHAGDRKEATAQKPIEDAPLPGEIILPLQQHAGVVCEPLVQAGDAVLVFQKVADTDAPVAAPIHSPVSGTVKAVGARFHPGGLKMASIVITPDGSQAEAELVSPPANPGPDEIRKLVRAAGIVGLGGAAFPTQIKLTPPAETKIDSVIINGCECEPYLTVDHRLMVESPEAIIGGLKLILKAVGAAKGYVGIEVNKPDAIEALAGPAGAAGVEVVPLEAKYPQGAEKQLIKSLLNREVPSKGLPSAVGALVQNVGTAIAIYEAVSFGRPLTRKVVTVSGGGISEPKNLRVYIGTPIKEVIALCGGLVDGAAKVILGGPMMGVALSSLEAPVIKATSGILALSAAETELAETQPCIKCARCVEACPMGLMPNRLGAMVEAGIWDELSDESLFDCIECGSCVFVCPSNRPLVQNIRLGKYTFAGKNRK